MTTRRERTKTQDLVSPSRERFRPARGRTRVTVEASAADVVFWGAVRLTSFSAAGGEADRQLQNLVSQPLESSALLVLPGRRRVTPKPPGTRENGQLPDKSTSGARATAEAFRFLLCERTGATARRQSAPPWPLRVKTSPARPSAREENIVWLVRDEGESDPRPAEPGLSTTPSAVIPCPSLSG